MGLLVAGRWQNQWYDTKESAGHFKRQEQAFRHWITNDASQGANVASAFTPDPNRYHLYVSLACPWAHRVLIMRALKGLETFFPVSVVHWNMGGKGWDFSAGPGVIGDPIHNARYLYEIYQNADKNFTGRVTVPIVWDKKTNQIVNNESSEIIRMMNTAFDSVGALPGNFYPPHLKDEIDVVNSRIYETLNNGVYKSGFATTQSAYEAAVYPLFDTLDWLEKRLNSRRYLVGNQLTEADIRLFSTLIRFDLVYFSHFKCNIRRLSDYPGLWAYTRDLYQNPKIRATVDFDHIKNHYYGSHAKINPSLIIPAGPVLDFDLPHNREMLA